MKKVSVCVPAYNRPEMVRQLIRSFLKQDYPNKELVISDDSSDGGVRKVVESFNSADIAYFPNVKNFGYCKNFLQAILHAKGDYVVMLGDDDLLLSSSALSVYARVFTEHPNVSYVYANQIQFSNRLDVQYLYKYFQKDTVYVAGDDAMRNIWTTSIFIPGLAIRRTSFSEEYYPKEDMLFPQLELVGHIINQHDAYGIAEYLVAGRAHSEQLGFYAIKGERIKGTEKHGTVELFSIFGKLAAAYRLTLKTDFLARNLIDRFLVTMLKEKVLVGRKKVRENYNNFCVISPQARYSKKLRFSFIIAMIMPKFAIRIARSMALGMVHLKYRNTMKAYRAQLRSMVT